MLQINIYMRIMLCYNAWFKFFLFELVTWVSFKIKSPCALESRPLLQQLYLHSSMAASNTCSYAMESKVNMSWAHFLLGLHNRQAHKGEEEWREWAMVASHSTGPCTVGQKPGSRTTSGQKAYLALTSKPRHLSWLQFPHLLSGLIMRNYG